MLTKGVESLACDAPGNLLSGSTSLLVYLLTWLHFKEAGASRLLGDGSTDDDDNNESRLTQAQKALEFKRMVDKDSARRGGGELDRRQLACESELGLRWLRIFHEFTNSKMVAYLLCKLHAAAGDTCGQETQSGESSCCCCC